MSAPTDARSTDALVDAAALAALGILALVGLQSVYDGMSALMVGGVGLVAGLLTGWVLGIRRLGPIPAMAVALGAFVLAGGPAVPSASIAGILPGPATPGALAAGLVRGWSNLITTAPPVGLGDGQGVIPYVLGFAPAAIGMVVATRTRLALVPAVASLVALASGFALGTVEPVNAVLQGGGFAAVALGWGAVRANRDRRSADGTIYWPRLLTGAAMVAVVMAAGAVGAPSLPFADGDRYAAREHVIPPFDPADYPSPLAGYRSYRSEAAKEQTFFTVEGLLEGARVRLATMDTYNGVVWVVSPQGARASGRFERVGRRILPVPAGEAATVTLGSETYEGVWVPSVGATRSASFAGSGADDLSLAFRYNRATGTGATPVPVAPGDEIALDAVLAPEPDAEALADAPVDASAVPPLSTGRPEADEALNQIGEIAFGIVGTGGTPYLQASKLAEHLATAGAFSDGGPDTSGPSRVPSGHSIVRITRFLEAEQPVGNAEQFAAAMALMARQIGLPARVVLGFTPEGEGVSELTGADADAWVEIAFQHGGRTVWVPFDPTPDEDKEPEREQRERPLEEELAQQEPPPPTYFEPPDTVPELADQSDRERPEDLEAAGGFALPRIVVLVATYLGAPTLVVASVVALIVGLKRARARRRRTRGSPAQRVHGAWLEAADRLRDLGLHPPVRATRREVALATGPAAWPGGRDLADTVDAATFGPVDPDDHVVDLVWQHATTNLAALHESLTRRRRLRAAVSLRSLRPRWL